jgi:hypothetical protein
MPARYNPMMIRRQFRMLAWRSARISLVIRAIGMTDAVGDPNHLSGTG